MAPEETADHRLSASRAAGIIIGSPRSAMTRSVCPNRVQGRSRPYYTSQTDGFWMSHERSQTNNPKEIGSSSTMAKYYNKDASYVQHRRRRGPQSRPRGEGRSTASRSRDRGRGVAAREVGPVATPRPQARDLLRRPPTQPSAQPSCPLCCGTHVFFFPVRCAGQSRQNRLVDGGDRPTRQSILYTT